MVGEKTWTDTCETDKAFRSFSVCVFLSIALTRYQVLLSDVIILKNEVLQQVLLWGRCYHFPPFYRWENWSTEFLDNLPTIMQLMINGRARFGTRQSGSRAHALASTLCFLDLKIQRSPMNIAISVWIDSIHIYWVPVLYQTSLETWQV